MNRRVFLLAAASVPWLAFTAACVSPRNDEWGASAAAAEIQLEQLERDLNGRLGIFALDTADGSRLVYRAGEHFPLCSTCKVLLVSAILEKSTRPGGEGLMSRRIDYMRDDLVAYSPVTEKHVETGMTVADLCAAAIQYSDNTSANLLMRMLGGPSAVTTFARSIGDREFRLDRWEPDLNTALPGDPRDSSTPEAMGLSLQRLILGDALAPRQRELLRHWLCGNTTGAARIRAGIPADWRVADKTGSGDYGTANDIAVLWSPRRAPVVLAVYTTHSEPAAKARNDIIASVARIAVHWAG